MSKVLVCYEFPTDQELFEDLWIIKKFGTSVWCGKSIHGRTMSVTLALEPEDASYVGLNRVLSPVPKIWESVLTQMTE